MGNELALLPAHRQTCHLELLLQLGNSWSDTLDKINNEALPLLLSSSSIVTVSLSVSLSSSSAPPPPLTKSTLLLVSPSSSSPSSHSSILRILLSSPSPLLSFGHRPPLGTTAIHSLFWSSISTTYSSQSLSHMLLAPSKSRRFRMSILLPTIPKIGICPGADNQGLLPFTTHSTQNLPNLCRTLV